MLQEKLHLAKEFNAFDVVTPRSLLNLRNLGEDLKDIVNGKEDLPSMYAAFHLWKESCVHELGDAETLVNILSLDNRKEIRIPIETNLAVIRDRERTPEEVRSNLELAYATMAVSACVRRGGTGKIITEFGETVPYLEPSDSKITIFPILRAALPAALSVGATLRENGYRPEFITARIARPHCDRIQDLRYYVDEQLKFLPPESIEGATVLIVDPLLALGGSVLTAYDLIKEYKPAKVSVLSLCATTYGLLQVIGNLKEHQTPFKIYTADIGHLDEQGMVRPGFGDIGDRLHGKETKGQIRDLRELIGCYRPREWEKYQPEIDGLFRAAGAQTPGSLKPQFSFPTATSPGEFDAGPDQP